MGYETLLVEKKDQITTITLNRPESRNAMNPTLHFEMCEALIDVEKDDDCRVLVVTGAGPAFCAGMDLQEYFFDTEGKPEERLKARKAAYEWMFKRLMVLPKPTIAAVNGWCFGGGFEIVGACDFAIASTSATFGLSEVNWGIFPGGGVTWLVTHLLSPRDAKYLVMTGKPITAEEAAKMRLINSAVAPEKLFAAVLELAEDFKQKHPAVLAAAKEVFRVDQDLTLEHALLWETAKFEELSLTAKNTWHKGVRQFKQERSFRPGLETYDWKK
ncbi:MAG: p-hydroxycinnamoyl CoA hydratase/lyase [Betaproteobacteria bacterium]|nr:p-hydroxycinnamoyl CoA hydratase/lyase [Betaproteobacteria bacterium]